MKNSKEDRWVSRTGLILAVASGAIGLGNFLRFPGQAAQNGGGAFMVPYIVSFIILGIPVCITEWIMGRRGGRSGHSAPFIFKEYLTGIPLHISGTIGVMIPILIYVYYVFIEAWCLSYAFYFLTGSIDLAGDLSSSSPGFRDSVVKNASTFFLNLTGSGANGDAFQSDVILFTLLCFMMNFAIVYRGISKGLEAFSKFAIPVMLISSVIVLIRILTLDGIGEGLGAMWNPDWSSLTNPKVWVAAAGQIFFSLSAGFGIALVFSSFLNKKDDVVLSSLSSATLNEFCEVALGGMITIPIAFLFLGAASSSFGTFGMGFIALPSVFAMMPAGQIFGALWFFVLFLAALTSSVTMLQPGILFLEEGFGFSKRKASLILFIFTISLCLPIIYFNQDFTSLDLTDFFVGTILIYILATIQILIFVWNIGVKEGVRDGNEGSHIQVPKVYQFIMKYITPYFLIIIFFAFMIQSLPEYIDKMSTDAMIELAASKGESIADAENKAIISRFVFLGILAIFGFTYLLVFLAYKNRRHREGEN
ncbi:sodium-dependent transporter [Leptospira sp. GIMC2001]|uniref:sodium-dependent transporter n=1 Tax=Leptospira sp. GIMC2001 TaxID=1513297 RepID=UPI00234B8718|nr:sodium-dependent transporter [Leptospira sp. GIMC2001]WCL48021.1 sodium-dependent transporter [Leptospira sp. GIMC2001]